MGTKTLALLGPARKLQRKSVVNTDPGVFVLATLLSGKCVLEHRLSVCTLRYFQILDYPEKYLSGTNTLAYYLLQLATK